jgi:hypothetical protein
MAATESTTRDGLAATGEGMRDKHLTLFVAAIASLGLLSTLPTWLALAFSSTANVQSGPAVWFVPEPLGAFIVFLVVTGAGFGLNAIAIGFLAIPVLTRHGAGKRRGLALASVICPGLTARALCAKLVCAVRLVRSRAFGGECSGYLGNRFARWLQLNSHQPDSRKKDLCSIERAAGTVDRSGSATR